MGKFETKLKEIEKNLRAKMKKKENDQEKDGKKRTRNLDKDSHWHPSQMLGDNKGVCKVEKPDGVSAFSVLYLYEPFRTYIFFTDFLSLSHIPHSSSKKNLRFKISLSSTLCYGLKSVTTTFFFLLLSLYRLPSPSAPSFLPPPISHISPTCLPFSLP